MTAPLLLMDCRGTLCSCGHYRHPASAIVTLFREPDEPFPVCWGTLDEWCARWPEAILRVDALGEEAP